MLTLFIMSTTTTTTTNTSKINQSLQRTAIIVAISAILGDKPALQKDKNARNVEKPTIMQKSAEAKVQARMLQTISLVQNSQRRDFTRIRSLLEVLKKQMKFKI